MPNKLILSKDDPDIAEALSDCKVGDTKTLEVTVEVTRDDDQVFEGDVTAVTYDAANPSEEEGESEVSEPAPKGKMSPSAGRQGEVEY